MNKNKEYKKLRDGTKGITLIALVVTIVVLLILATISVAQLLGENGLIYKARQAKDKNEIGWEKEIVDITLSEIRSENKGVLNFDKNTLETKLRKNANTDKINVEQNGTEYIVRFTESNRTYPVTGEFPKVADDTPNSINQKDDNTYLIQSIEDLVILSNNVYTGQTYEGKTFELETDLDFKSTNSYIDATSTAFGDVNENGQIEPLIEELAKGEGFAPIGTWNKVFSGNIQGNNNIISNLYINKRNEPVGFIGIGKNNIIQNLILENVNLQVSSSYVASIIAKSEGTVITIEKCKASGEIKAINSYPVAGILGEQENSSGADIKISECINETNLTGYYGGGIVGSAEYINKIEVTNCVNSGKINTSSSNGTGGIIGKTYYCKGSIIIKGCNNSADIINDNRGFTGGVIGVCEGDSSYDVSATIENCHNTGKIQGNGAYVGGVIGEIYNVKTSEIKKCYNTAEVKNNANYTGGIIGRTEKDTYIGLCYNTGNVNNEEYNIGGILGAYEGNVTTGYLIEKTYNTGNITGKQCVGGIVGNNQSSETANTTIQFCYNEGDITATQGSVGGIVGQTASPLKNCYNIGDINSGGSNAGGILGVSYYAKVENTYNLGKVTGKESGNTGGIVGRAKKVSNSFNVGIIDIPTGQNYTGAVAGYVSEQDGLSTCYYLKGSYVVGYGYAQGTDVTQIVESEESIKNLINSTFSSIAGWKAGTSGTNSGYPVLDI